MQLKNMPVGAKCKVVGFNRGQPRGHLLPMGLTPGVCVELVERAPLGDPVVLQVRDIRLSVRSQDTAALQFEPV